MDIFFTEFYSKKFPLKCSTKCKKKRVKSIMFVQEIDRINRMQDRAPQLVPYESELPRWITHEPYKRIFGPIGSYGTLSHVSPYFEYPQLLPSKALMAAGTVPRKHVKALHKTSETTTNKEQEAHKMEIKKDSKVFALTPRDEGYFDPSEKNKLMRK